MKRLTKKDIKGKNLLELKQLLDTYKEAHVNWCNSENTFNPFDPNDKIFRIDNSICLLHSSITQLELYAEIMAK